MTTPRTLLVALSLFTLASLSPAQCGDETFKFHSSDGEAGDYLGAAVAVSGNVAIAGALGDDDLGGNAGAAYLFDAVTGVEYSKLLAPDGAGGDLFGFAVAISGNFAIIGAPSDDDSGPSSGSAYIFDVSTGQQVRKLLASDGDADDAFGMAVSISGNVAIVGAPNDNVVSGSAYLFDISTGLQMAKLVPTDPGSFDWFGYSVGVSGNTAIVGAFGNTDFGIDSGSAYLFDVSSGQQTAKLLAPDGAAKDVFGLSVAISGDIAIVGAPVQGGPTSPVGRAYLFDANTGQQLFKLLPNDSAPQESFGLSVAIDGNTALVGKFWDSSQGMSLGAAYLFDTATGQQTEKLLTNSGSNLDYFAVSLAISGGKVVLGAEYDDDLGNDAGASYLFDALEFDSYCTASPNSTGAPAFLTACGSNSITDNSLRLTAAPVPNTFSLFFYGSSQVQVPLGDGVLCTAGGIIRLNPSMQSIGNTATRIIDLPVEVGLAGSLHFQCWYRDAAAGGTGINLSDAITITFVP